MSNDKEGFSTQNSIDSISVYEAESGRFLWENTDKSYSDSSVDAFANDDNFLNNYYLYRVKFGLNIYSNNSSQSILDSILNPSYFDYMDDEVLALWRKIAIEECIEYLLYQFERVYFDFKAGEKSYKVFDMLLDDFSISQVFGIIHKCVSDASKLCLERRITKRHTANTTVSLCEKYASRALYNKWDLQKFSRPKDLPQSEVSMFFFNKVLKIHEAGFNEVIIK